MKRNRTALRRGVFVVLCVGEREVEKLGAGSIAFPDEAVTHAAGRFLIVARPAAVEVDL